MSLLQERDQPTSNSHPVRILQDLLRYNTTNPPGNEIECIHYIKHLLDEAGISSLLLALDPGRPNLIARNPGKGISPPFMLYGHVDVVPAEDQKWVHPPFEGKLVDNVVWGRGALDMKGGVAMMLAAFIRAKIENISLPGDVVFAALSDEETLGKFGAKFLVENHADLFKNIRYAIGEFGASTFYIGNKTFYPIMVNEKKICGVLAHIHGPTGHSTIPMHGGAMAELGRILQKLDSSRLPVHITTITRQMIQTMADSLTFPLNLLMSFLLNPVLTDRALDALGAKGQVFDPMLHNTVNPMLVKGGEHLGQVPGEVILHMVCPLLPGYSEQDIISELKGVMGDKVDLEITHYETVPDEPDMGKFSVLGDILREADPAGVPLPFILPAPTDGHTFARLGIQTYGFLPMKFPPDFNFWELLHAPDERITVEALNFGTEAIFKLLQRF
jgi:acetylornithine deacetylase/succinyl-diaminopimelate desuccinylase-like protein